MNDFERRSEPRFPLSLPLQIHESENLGSSALSCRTENISLSGFLIQAPQGLARGQQRVFVFDLPECDACIRAQGISRWCSSNGQYRFGIQLTKKQAMASFLQKVTDSLFTLKPAEGHFSRGQTSGSLDLLQGFYPEIFWGLFFRNMKSQLQSRLISLSGELELKRFYVSELHSSFREEALNGQIQERLSSLDQTMERTVQLLDSQVRFLQQLLNPQLQRAEQGIEERIQLKELVLHRMKRFQDLQASLFGNGYVWFETQLSEVPAVSGCSENLGLSFDFILFHIYQYVLFFGAKRIGITLKADQQEIGLELRNDGSSMFHQKTMHLEARHLRGGPDYGQRIQNRLAGLRCALALWKPARVRLQLSNQSGNNALHLKIPVQKGTRG